MVDFESEAFVPHRLQGALLVAGFNSLILDLQNYVWITGPIHVHGLEISGLDYMHSQDAPMHDAVFIQLL